MTTPRLIPLTSIPTATVLGPELFTQLALSVGGVWDQPALGAALDLYFDRRMAECVAMPAPEVNPAGLVVVNVDPVADFLFAQIVSMPAEQGGAAPPGQLDLFEYVIERMHMWQATHPTVHLHMGGVNYWASLRDLSRDEIFGGLLYMSQAVVEDERSGGKRTTPASLFISMDASSTNQAAYGLVAQYSARLDDYLGRYTATGLGTLTAKQLRRGLRKRQSGSLVLFHVVAQLAVLTDESTRRARSHPFAGLAYSLPLLELCLVFEDLLAPKLPRSLRTLGQLIPAYRPPTVSLTASDINISNASADANFSASVSCLLDRRKLIGRRRHITSQERDVLLVHAVRNESAHRADRSLVLAERFEDIASHLVFAILYAVEELWT